jgi:hypothetical protein
MYLLNARITLKQTIDIFTPMARRELTQDEKRLKEQKKYTNLHGGPEVRVDTNQKYFCLGCGTFLFAQGSPTILRCPVCLKKFDWQKYVIKTPVL